MLERVWLDLRHASRMLRKNPGFTSVAMLSIAIGIGLNAAMFSLADALALRPLQVPQSSDVVAVTTSLPQQGDAVIPIGRSVSYRDYVDLRDRTESFAGLLAYSVTITSFADRADEPPQTSLGLAVSGNFFEVLRVPPAVGRTFVPADDLVPGRDAVAVLAYETWRQRYAGDPTIVGRHARIGGVDFMVIGVAPQEFPGMDLVLHPAFYVPLAMMPSLAGSAPDCLERRDLRFLSIRGRLQPGVAVAQADAEVRQLATSLQRLYPDTNRQVSFRAVTDLEERRANRGPATPAAWTLMMLAMLVLVVACANVAGLLLSRAPVRAREIALRLAIGGSRFHVVQQLLTESVLIAVAGAALGLAVGYAAISSFGRLRIVSDIGVSLVVQMDRRVLTLTLILTAVSALLAGTFPAWRTASSPDLTGTLSRGSVSDAPGTRLWGRHVLAGQIALSLAIVTIGVFLYRTFATEFGHPGFRTDRMLLVNFEPSLAMYDDERAVRFYRLLTDRVRELPGVTSVGLTSFMPLNQDHRERTAIVPEGYQLPPGSRSLNVFSARVNDGYFDTIGIPIVAGRDIAASDTRETTPIAVINQAMADRYWPGVNPIGKRLRLEDGSNRSVQVVGVVATSKYNWVGESPTPFLYLPQSQTAGSRATLLVGVNSRNAAAALAPSVRQVVRELDRNMPVSVVRTMEEFYYGSAVAAISQFVRVVGGIGVIGVVLAMVGLYGLVAYSARRRTREIAVRMAVGAQPAAILRLIMRHGFMLSATGTAAGIAASFAAGRLLRALLPNVQGIDISTYLLVVPTLVLITACAALIPAWRAARIDPLVALRTE